jgi:class 3 adenylate cyclase
MADLPSRTVTFLSTDVVGSTRLCEEYPNAMRGALARHDAIVRNAITAYGDHLVKRTGNGVHPAFATANDALGATIDRQLFDDI